MASHAVGSEVVQDFVRQPSDTKRMELMICFDAPGEVGQKLEFVRVRLFAPNPFHGPRGEGSGDVDVCTALSGSLFQRCVPAALPRPQW